jgi:hypothetical protein
MLRVVRLWIDYIFPDRETKMCLVPNRHPFTPNMARFSGHENTPKGSAAEKKKATPKDGFLGILVARGGIEPSTRGFSVQPTTLVIFYLSEET